MCVICALANNAKISEQEWDNCWDSNPHGFGFMYVNENEEIVIKKEMEQKPAKQMFFEDFEQYYGKTPFVLHFRVASHGSKCIENTHPFEVRRNKRDGRLTLAYCHNGIIRQTLPSKDDDRSDTRIFRDMILSQMPLNFLSNDAFTWMIEDFIGYSKLAFLSSDKKITILNSNHGEYEWENGRWFSNTSYKSRRVTKSSSSSTPTTYGGYAYKSSKTEESWNKLPNGTWVRGCDPCATPKSKQTEFHGMKSTPITKDDENEIPDGVPTNKDVVDRFGVKGCDICKQLVPMDEYHYEWECCFKCIEERVGIKAQLDRKIVLEGCVEDCKGVATRRGIRCLHWPGEIVAYTEEQMHAVAQAAGFPVGV